MSQQLIQKAFDRIDAVNARDPRMDRDGDTPVPKELLYGRRMTEWLNRLYPEASDALRIAVRAQHIARWRIPRDEYPQDRRGYKRWRTELMELHAQLAGDIAEALGYDDDTVERIRFLIQKRKLKRDPETQALEDTACLVFLNYEFAAFADEHPEEKVIDIVRKTWGKMSERGHEAALALPLGSREQRLVEAALSAGDA